MTNTSNTTPAPMSPIERACRLAYASGASFSLFAGAILGHDSADLGDAHKAIREKAISTILIVHSEAGFNAPMTARECAVAVPGYKTILNDFATLAKLAKIDRDALAHVYEVGMGRNGAEAWVKARAEAINGFTVPTVGTAAADDGSHVGTEGGEEDDERETLFGFTHKDMVLIHAEALAESDGELLSALMQIEALREEVASLKAKAKAKAAPKAAPLKKAA